MLMEIREISNIYSALPQCGAFLKAVNDESVKHLFLKGMVASSAPVFFAAAASRTENDKKGTQKPLTAVFILQDNDEAGYFYHDLTQILGTDNVLFFP